MVIILISLFRGGKAKLKFETQLFFNYRPVDVKGEKNERKKERECHILKTNDIDHLRL